MQAVVVMVVMGRRVLVVGGTLQERQMESASFQKCLTFTFPLSLMAFFFIIFFFKTCLCNELTHRTPPNPTRQPRKAFMSPSGAAAREPAPSPATPPLKLLFY